VDTSSSGAEAIHMVENNCYDLVFMDHMMPGMNGITATAAIRRLGEDENDYFHKLPIVALTANAIAGQREMFLKNGMDDFLAKPIEMQKLDNILRKWLPKEKQEDLAGEEQQPRTGHAAFHLDVKGVNHTVGLRNVGGNTAAYRDILFDFCADAHTHCATLKTSMENTNLQAYAITSHALKGSLRTIGAEKLSHLAASLESASTKGELDFIESETENFIKGLQALVGDLYTALEKAAGGDDSAAPGKPDVSMLKLDLLKDALIRMEIQTVNDLLSGYMNMELNSAQKKIIAEIEQAIIVFEYDKAIEKINFHLAD
jgi:CheY-like chemotaxis protein